MNAGKVGRWQALPALAPRKPVIRRPDRSQVKTSAEAAGSRDVLIPCKTKTAAFQQRPSSGMKERLGRSSRPATIPRINGLRIPPNLLNPPKGLSMAKTAHVSSQLARKSVPVAELPKGAHLPQSRTCETVIPRGYTLCEVDQRSRKELPTAKPPRSAPEKAFDFGTTPGPILGQQKTSRRILSGSVVIPGLTAMGCSLYGPHPKTDPAPSLGWRGETALKPIGIVEGGAA